MHDRHSQIPSVLQRPIIKKCLVFDPVIPINISMNMLLYAYVQVFYLKKI